MREEEEEEEAAAAAVAGGERGRLEGESLMKLNPFPTS